jgi:protein-disulfide isomerase
VSPLVVPVTSEDHAQGETSAPVTLVEYGDYECPYCGEAHPVVKALQRHFGKRLRFVYRNFPLTQAHPYAEPAAEVAEAAAAQGKFWEMHDAIYEHQSSLEQVQLLRYAEEAGLDVGAIAEGVAAHTYASRVRRDFLGGVRSGVNGTPSFFINGTKYEGDYDVPSMTDAIDQELTAIRRK